jgi:hypothetical protein
MAIEKGNSSLIAVLSTFSAPDTVSYAFLKVVNNSNYTSQTVGALVGERLEYKKDMARDEVLPDLRREMPLRQKEFSFVKETRASKTTDDIVERGSKKEAPSGRIHSTEAFSVIGGKIAAQKESFSDKVTSQREVSGSQNTTIVSH